VHEYSLVEALVRRVEEEVHRQGATRVHGLRVRIGGLAGVDAELFRTAYETFRQGTVCEGAALELAGGPAGWACPRCGSAIPPGAVLHCAACGVPARLAEGADALTLDAIDLEVP
jgi:hydrogenase nickel incorporation protein HypA/HybF